VVEGGLPHRGRTLRVKKCEAKLQSGQWRSVCGISVWQGETKCYAHRKTEDGTMQASRPPVEPEQRAEKQAKERVRPKRLSQEKTPRGPLPWEPPGRDVRERELVPVVRIGEVD
jgi:hypothetical protein